MLSFTVVVTVPEISTVRNTEIWTFLEDDARCAAWFNSGHTLTRQSTFPPAVNCSAFAPGVQVNLVVLGDR